MAISTAFRSATASATLTQMARVTLAFPSPTGPTLFRSEERRVGKEWRYWRDWSSDVCSSDLAQLYQEQWRAAHQSSHAAHLPHCDRHPDLADGCLWRSARRSGQQQLPLL